MRQRKKQVSDTTTGAVATTAVPKHVPATPAHTYVWCAHREQFVAVEICAKCRRKCEKRKERKRNGKKE